ncbi:P-loop containing nucleoside triphosphate hydrolase protein, partial [Mycena floridula]
LEEARVRGFKEGFELHPHQITARKWMKETEEKYKGAILADDMGLVLPISSRYRCSKFVRPSLPSFLNLTNLSFRVVCPPSLISTWADEIKRLTRLDVHIHHGEKRRSTGKSRYWLIHSSLSFHSASAFLSRKDIRKKTSWSTLSLTLLTEDADRPKKRKRKTSAKKYQVRDALFEVKWHRVILDEASHKIKNSKSQTSKACCFLTSRLRWCLTGTPLHNSVSDLFSLFLFLRKVPGGWHDEEYFNREIKSPIESGVNAEKAVKLLHVTLSRIMLRRLKSQLVNGRPIIDLPTKKIEIRTVQMDTAERQFNDALESRLRDKVEVLVATFKRDQQKKGNASRAWVLRNCVYVMLLRLRQACDHPDLHRRSWKTSWNQIRAGYVAQSSYRCSFCYSSILTGGSRFIPAPGVTSEKYCDQCAPAALIGQIASFKGKASAKIRELTALLSDIFKLNASNPQAVIPSPTRGRAIVPKRRKEETPDKVVIYSQFTTMLELVQPHLQQMGIEFVQYDGKMSLKQRDVALKAIRTKASVSVILVSLMAGGTGLNLSCCSHLILIDPWYNPAIEASSIFAFDRVHRIGQLKPVNIYKLIVENSVEERILDLQHRKRQLAKTTLDAQGIANAKRMTTDELVSLFRPTTASGSGRR